MAQHQHRLWLGHTHQKHIHLGAGHHAATPGPERVVIVGSGHQKRVAPGTASLWSACGRACDEALLLAHRSTNVIITHL